MRKKATLAHILKQNTMLKIMWAKYHAVPRVRPWDRKETLMGNTGGAQINTGG